MDEHDVYAGYALALALIPEANVAGDLLAAARDAADLRRRLDGWRRANRLPPAPLQPELPALAAEQCAHALHLWRKAQRRRQLRPALSAAGGALLVAALVLGSHSYLSYRASLPGDPVYGGQPVAAAESATVQFTVYRAEATPTRVTVWWAVSGAGARAYAGGEGPQLYNLFTGRFGRRRQAADSKTVVLRDGRVLGKSSYPAQGLLWSEAMLGLRAPSDKEPPLRLDFPVTEQDDPGTRVLTPRQTVQGEGWSATLEQVRVAPGYVAVRSRIEGHPGWSTLHRLELQVDGKPLVLDEIQSATRSDVNFRQSLFPPLPSGASHLQVRYLLGQVQQIDYDLRDPPVRKTERTSAEFTATVALPAGQVVPTGVRSAPLALFLAPRRRSYPSDRMAFAPDPADPRQTLYTFTARLPQQVEPTTLRLQAIVTVPGGALPVDLGR